MQHDAHREHIVDSEPSVAGDGRNSSPIQQPHRNDLARVKAGERVVPGFVPQLGDELQKHADRVVEKAIIGMLPHNKLSRQVQKKLRVYVGPEHPHSAQKPVPYEIKQVAQ